MFNKNKSPETFFSKTLPNDNMLLIVNKNILYLTHQVDKCLKLLQELKVNEDLQMQVDDFFTKTSPQTDKENKTPPLDEQ